MCFIVGLMLLGEVFLTLRAQGYNYGNTITYGGSVYPYYIPYPYSYGMGVGPYIEQIVDYVMPVTGFLAEDYDDLIMPGNPGVTWKSMLDRTSPIIDRIGYGGAVPSFGSMAGNYGGLAYSLPTALPAVNIPTAVDNYNDMVTNYGDLSTGFGDSTTGFGDLTRGFGDFMSSYNNLFPSYSDLSAGYKNLLPAHVDTPTSDDVLPVVGNINFDGKVRARGKLTLVRRFGCK